MPRHNNRTITRVCPTCGKKRPLDWFDKEPEQTRNHVAFHPCWKCKALKIGNEKAGDAEGGDGYELIG